MKRIISLLLIVVLCLGTLTGCEVIDTVTGFFGGDEEGVTKAAIMLHNIYKNKGEATSADFDVVKQVVVDGKEFPVTWECDNDKIKIVESTKAGYYTVDLPEVNAEEFTYTLTATIVDGKYSAERSYTFKMLAVNNNAVVTEPVEGVDYKFYFFQGKYQQNLYVLNTTQDDGHKFINTSNDPKDGAVFQAEKADGGYKFFTMIDGVKNYVYAYTTQSGDKISKFIGFSAENSTVFYYNAEAGGVWMTNINGSPYGVGTYSDFKTLCISDGSFFSASTVNVSQFVMKIVAAEYADSQTPDEEVKVEVPAANSTLTIAEALELGVKVPSYTEGKYYVEGQITEVYNDQYGNMYITDGTNTFCIYGTYDKTGANRYDAMENAPKVGDTIVVYGVIGNYNGTAQMKNGWIQSINGVELEGATPETPDTPAGSIVLNLTGNANLVSGSANQNVFAANGITFTNDKASSSSDLTVQESYAQRAYKGSTVKIEYPGMTKIVITFDDYESNGKTYMAGFDGMTVEGATITRENDVLTIIFSAATDVFQSTELSSQVRIEKIEVYTGKVEAPEQGGTDKPSTPSESYEAPVANQGYILYMTLPTKTVYFAGALDQGKYLATTADKTAAVAIYFEVVDGGYHIYFNDANGVKTYINAAGYKKSNGYLGCHFSTSTTAECVWTFDTTLGILEVKAEFEGLDPDTFFPGTYDNNGIYETMSLSGSYYKDQLSGGKQFPARLEKVAHTHEYTSAVTAPTCTEAGYTTYTCSCGHTYTEAGAAATGHTEAIDAAVAASCTETGLTEGKHCSVCNVVLVAQNIVPANGHTDADKNFVCDVESCKADLCTEHTAAEAVKESEQAPTCTEPGYYVSVVKCSKCGDELSRETVVVEAPGHTEAIDAAVPATCTTDGKTEGKHCSVCNHVITAQTVVPATGHNYVDGVCSCGATNIVTLPETNGEWIIVTELKTGDQVIIGNPVYGKLLTSLKYNNGYYNAGVDYSHTNFANVTDAEIWTVTVNADGTYTFTDKNGTKLGMGDQHTSFKAEGPHYSWVLEALDGGLFYVKNTGREAYIEWYDQNNNWSGFKTSNLNDLFELHFYVKGEGNQGGTDTPVEPETPDTPDTPDTPEVPEGGIYTIPEVLASAEGTAVIVKGTVVEIYQAWNPQFNNVSFYIADADGNRLLVFRTGTNAKIGDQVTVTGTTTLYSNVIQIAQGSTTVIDVAHVCSEYSTATCISASACVICGAINAPATGHSYVDGTCANCGEAEPTAPAVKYHLQATISDTTYYWTGAASGGKGVLTTDASAAAELFVEDAGDGKVHIYYVDANGGRVYLYFTDGNTGFKTSSDIKTIKYDSDTGKVYEDSFSEARYAATYGVQDIRSYKSSNVPGSSNNAFMLLTPIA